MSEEITTTRTTCPYCGVGCGVLATPQADGSVDIQGDPEHPANFGRLCSKGSALGETVSLDGRLLHPQIDHQPVSWDRALDRVAGDFQRIIDEHGPDAVAFYVSGQVLTEDYYVANKLMKGFIGSGNIDTNSRLCMSSAVAAHKRAFGSDAVPCSYEDLEQTDLLVLTGSNLAWCHPVIYQRIVQAKKDRPELKVVVIDPRKTATCDVADLHLPLRPGSDAHLFNGLLHYLKTSDALDWEYIEEHVEGFAKTLKTASETAGSIPAVSTATEIPETELVKFFQLFATTDKVVTLFSQGVNQSASGTDKINAIINCHLATGRIGKAGAGPFSMTGQPNAMGGREVGGLANQLAAHMEISNPEHHDRVSRFWQTDKLTETAGLKAVDLFEQVKNGQIKAVWVMATNPLVSLPDADRVRQALQDCELLVVSECEQHTDLTEIADVLLPALTWGEKDGTVTNSERRISHQRAFLPSPGEARADWQMITDVAHRMGYGEWFDYQEALDVFREHAALSAFENDGTRDFDIGHFADLTESAFREFSPVQWPVFRDQPAGTARLFEDGQFYTESGKARMVPVTPQYPEGECSDAYPLWLNTGRIRDQWHTMTRTGRAPRLSTHTPEPTIELHPLDAASGKLQSGQLAVVSSEKGELIGRVVTSQDQRPGSVFVPIHWNRQFASKAVVSALVSSITDPLSGQPQAKQTPVNIRAFKARWHGFILSRERLSLPVTAYHVKVKGEQFWRYELAGEQDLLNPAHWAQTVMGGEGEWLEFADTKAGRYRAARVVEDKLQTVIFIAPDHNLPERTWLSQLFLADELDGAQRQSLLAGRPGPGQSDCGAIVCACFGVGEKTIETAVVEQSLDNVDAIGSCLNAGTNCGSCIPELQQILSRTKTD